MCCHSFGVALYVYLVHCIVEMIILCVHYVMTGKQVNISLSMTLSEILQIGDMSDINRDR